MFRGQLLCFWAALTFFTRAGQWIAAFLFTGKFSPENKTKILKNKVVLEVKNLKIQIFGFHHVAKNIWKAD